MSEVLNVKDKVQRYLLDLGVRPEVTEDGGWTFRTGSARVFVRVREQTGEDSSRTLVELTAPVLFGVTPSAELWEYVALSADNWVFGHLWAAKQDEDDVTLLLSHRLLGDYLDPEELKSAVAGLAISAEEIDDQLADRFGGRRFHEES